MRRRLLLSSRSIPVLLLLLPVAIHTCILIQYTQGWVLSSTSSAFRSKDNFINYIRQRKIFGNDNNKRRRNNYNNGNVFIARYVSCTRLSRGCHVWMANVNDDDNNDNDLLVILNSSTTQVDSFQEDDAENEATMISSNQLLASSVTSISSKSAPSENRNIVSNNTIPSTVSSSTSELLMQQQSSSLVSLSLIDVASSITQDNCHLLGVKSIGVDYGLVRTGISVTVGYEPKPITILCDTNMTQICLQVIHYTKSEQAKLIVVGLPFHKNGTIAEQTNKTLIFGQLLTRMVLQSLGPSIDVVFFDERYTSKEAAARAHSANPNSNLYGTLDADAACIILENYYNDNGTGGYRITLDPIVRQECIENYHQQRSAQNELQRQITMQRHEKITNRKNTMLLRAMEEEKLLSSFLSVDNSTTTEPNHNGIPKKRKKKKKK